MIGANEMMITTNVHAVNSIRAVYYSPRNSNAVCVAADIGRGITHETTYFFGDGPEASSRAAAFFYALGGTEDQVR
jgi:hypothetical protein